MFSKFRFRAPIVALGILLFTTAGFGAIVDETDPEITDRVARISQLVGDVDIKRADADEAEKAVLNLPIVQGDVIVTGPGARFEIQFSSRKYLRVSENSQITITTLQETGIAVSLMQGTAAVRTIEFDKDSEFFEVDAPKTTVAVQRSGHYLIDAGVNGESVRVTVTEDGEARVYSETSGFTLRDGRSAQLFVGGNRPGEWDIADASDFTSDFLAWSLDRDKTIAANLKDAYYDRYYDRDIYGAEDLNQNGEWIYTASYGYVWRPYSSVTSRYADWSPYRYGHWRWISPYGWTWINDEPWGWATYHHGRWVWDNGYWYWSPYGYYRYRRSWWSPALVVMTVYNSNVCWYPLPYNYRRYNHRRQHRRDRHNSGPVAVNPTPSPGPNPGTGTGPIDRRGGNGRLPIDSVPPTAVIAVKQDEFGLPRGGGRLPAAASRAVLSKTPDVTTPPILPSFEDVKSKAPIETRAERRSFPQANRVQTGAAQRKVDVPMDAELQKSRMYGNRPPLQTTPVVTPGINPGINSAPVRETKRTGAVERPVIRDEPSKRTVTETPPYMPPMPPAETPKQRDTPRYEPPARKETPRYEPPPRKEQPRYEPPARRETPRYEPPQRSDPPKSSPPPKSDPPPSKSEPSKPSESAPLRKGKG